MISTGKVTVQATVEGLVRHPRTRAQLESGALNETMADLALTAAMPESNPIEIQRVNVVGETPPIQLTHYLAVAIAIIFTGFTALVGSASLLQEKTRWTLQRMYVTPTRPGIILGGKTLGTYLNGLIQIGVLIGGMAAMEWVSSSRPDQVSRINLCGLAILVLAVAAAATGMGVAIAGFARTYNRAANYGWAILLLMGLAGGIFFPVELFPRPFDLLSRVTFHYWAMNGYLKLASGGNTISILPHGLILAAMGWLFFAIGSYLLRRRIEFL
jgi:ABC-2 type transport system permease protein